MVRKAVCVEALVRPSCRGALIILLRSDTKRCVVVVVVVVGVGVGVGVVCVGVVVVFVVVVVVVAVVVVVVVVDVVTSMIPGMIIITIIIKLGKRL